jgi:prepilin-type processing-associated H-X9-DG protein
VFGSSPAFRSGIFIKSKTLAGGVMKPLDQLIGPADVLDGLSYTIMVSEKRVNQALLGGPQLGDQLGYTSGFGITNLRNGNLPPLQDAVDPLESVGDGFGSAHPAGMNAVFADGSVRTISYQISASPQVLPLWNPLMRQVGIVPLPSPPYPPNSVNVSLFQRLCMRADGGTISAAELE